MDSSNIDKIIEKRWFAKEMNHEYCTLEHVTLSLLENKDTRLLSDPNRNK